jgi:GNAT superfamily N-acetyltransferase/predicted nucleic acid-binding protein
MIQTQAIDDKSPYLEDVKHLWRSNSHWLGYYPEGAFQDRARRRQIIVALKNKVCCGYLIYFRTERRKVRLSHLCIKDGHRGEGLARRLIESLRSSTKDDLGISLYCRRDFPTWNLWPKLGFVALDQKRGRGRDETELTFYWLANPQANLLGLLKSGDDERMDVVLDANVFYDLDDPIRNGAEESQGIVADWLRPLVRLCITEELFNEIQRHPDQHQRSERLRTAKTFDCLECTSEEFQTIELEVRGLVGEPKNERDAADIRQVARAVASLATVFVTRDEILLEFAELFYSKYGLSVVRPSHLVGRFEELRNEKAYQQERLAGTRISKSRISSFDESLTSAFQELRSGEKKKSLERRLDTYLSSPDKYECFVIADRCRTPTQPIPLALYVVERVPDQVCKIPIFRLSTSIRSTRMAITLFRTLLAGIIEQACKSHTKVVIFEEPTPDPAWAESLSDSGFIKSGSAWVKLSLRMIDSPSSIAQVIRRTLLDAGLVCEGLVEIADYLAGESIRNDPMDASEVEHILWPAKLLGCGIPSYLVPIRPGWASDLFDSGLADRMLWAADSELALNPESVYYRSARPNPFRPFGRLLWYISQVKNDPETMRIRACSRLADVVIGPATDLFREFRRLGVYAWKDVLKTAKNVPEGRIMALRFDDTELFPRTLKWNDFQQVLADHGTNTNIQSPVEIPEAALVELYKLGFGIE